MTTSTRPSPAKVAAARRRAANRAVTAALAALPDDPDTPIPVPFKTPYEWLHDIPDWYDPNGPLIQVDPTNGRVAAMVAPYDECVLNGRPGCWRPPRSHSNYEYAHPGVTHTDRGPVRTANVGGNINHPNVWASAEEAVDVYANTATRKMVGRYVDSPHGILFLGSLYPGSTARDVHEVQSFALSGDWRWIESFNDHEMVGSQLVGNPAFRPNLWKLGRVAAVSFTPVIPEHAAMVASADCGCDDMPERVTGGWAPTATFHVERPLTRLVESMRRVEATVAALVVADAATDPQMPVADDDGEDWADELAELEGDACEACKAAGCPRCAFTGYHDTPDAYAQLAAVLDDVFGPGPLAVTAGLVRNRRGVLVWHDPNTGRFAPLGFISPRVLKRLFDGDGEARTEVLDKIRGTHRPGMSRGELTARVLGERPRGGPDLLHWGAAERLVHAEFPRLNRRPVDTPERRESPAAPRADRPLILPEGETVDDLDQFDYTMIRADKLKPGMILVDPDLHTPVYAIDHRNRAKPRSGAVKWLVEDLENGGWREQDFGRNTEVPVATRRRVEDRESPGLPFPEPDPEPADPGAAVREQARTADGPVPAVVADNRMRPVFNQGDRVDVEFVDDDTAKVVGTSSSGKRRAYKVKWDRFTPAEDTTPAPAPEPDTPEPDTPDPDAPTPPEPDTAEPKYGLWRKLPDGDWGIYIDPSAVAAAPGDKVRVRARSGKATDVVLGEEVSPGLFRRGDVKPPKPPKVMDPVPDADRAPGEWADRAMDGISTQRRTVNGRRLASMDSQPTVHETTLADGSRLAVYVDASVRTRDAGVGRDDKLLYGPMSTGEATWILTGPDGEQVDSSSNRGPDGDLLPSEGETAEVFRERAKRWAADAVSGDTAPAPEPDAPEPVDPEPTTPSPVTVEWSNPLNGVYQATVTGENEAVTVNVDVRKPYAQAPDAVVLFLWDNGEIDQSVQITRGVGESDDAFLARVQNWVATAAVARGSGDDMPAPPEPPEGDLPPEPAPPPDPNEITSRSKLLSIEVGISNAIHSSTARAILPHREDAQLTARMNPESGTITGTYRRQNDQLIDFEISLDSDGDGVVRARLNTRVGGDGPGAGNPIGQKNLPLTGIPARKVISDLLAGSSIDDPDLFGSDGAAALGAKFHETMTAGGARPGFGWRIPPGAWDSPDGWRAVTDRDHQVWATHPSLNGAYITAREFVGRDGPAPWTVHDPTTGEQIGEHTPDGTELAALKGLISGVDATPDNVEVNSLLAEAAQVAAATDVEYEAKVEQLGQIGDRLRVSLYTAEPDSRKWAHSPVHVAAVTEFGDHLARAARLEASTRAPKDESALHRDQFLGGVYEHVLEHIDPDQARQVRELLGATDWTVTDVSVSNFLSDGRLSVTMIAPVVGDDGVERWRSLNLAVKWARRDGEDASLATLDVAWIDAGYRVRSASDDRIERMARGRVDESKGGLISSGVPVVVPGNYRERFNGMVDDALGARPPSGYGPDAVNGAGLRQNDSAEAVRALLDRTVPGGLGLTGPLRRRIRVAKGTKSRAAALPIDAEPIDSTRRKQLSGIAETGLGHFPTSWVESLGEFTFSFAVAKKGYTGGTNWTFSDRATIHTAPDVPDTIVHEFGHTFEEKVPGLRAMVYAHLDTRFDDDEPITGLQMGSGRSRRMRGANDQLTDEYSKRLYGGGARSTTWREAKKYALTADTEYLSTGTEALVHGSHRGSVRYFGMDPTRDAFILGVLTMFVPEGVPGAAELTGVEGAEAVAGPGADSAPVAGP